MLSPAFADRVAKARQAAAVPSARQSAAAGAAQKSPERALLDRYCVGCHNQRTKTAGLTLDAMDVADVAEHAERGKRSCASCAAA